MSALFSDEFAAQAFAAGNRARLDMLALGVPVFYEDPESGLDIMERPDGRRFEIRYIAAKHAGENYEVIREIVASAA